MKPCLSVLLSILIFSCADTSKTVSQDTQTKPTPTPSNKSETLKNITCITTGRSDDGDAILDAGYKVVLNDKSQISFYQTSGWGPDVLVFADKYIATDPHLFLSLEPGFIVYDVHNKDLDGTKITNFRIKFKATDTKIAKLDLKYNGKPVLAALQNLTCR